MWPRSMRVPWWFISFLFNQKIKRVVADAKWSELTTGGVVCLLHVFLLQMILAVIEGLGDKNGSNKSTISMYMEGKYGKLPRVCVAADRAPDVHDGVRGAHLPQEQLLRH
jgi:hypothetical protein